MVALTMGTSLVPVVVTLAAPLAFVATLAAAIFYNELAF